MKPGIYENISNDAYHGGAGISKSGLDLIAKSPAHYKAVIDGITVRKSTLAQNIGTIFHALILELDVFNASYIREINTDKYVTINSKDELLSEAEALNIPVKKSDTIAKIAETMRAAGAEFTLKSELKEILESEYAGREVIDESTYTQLMNMRDAVFAHPAANKLLSVPGKAEYSVYWHDPETGVLCRCRPDFWRNDGIIVDLKTTVDASPEGFAKSIANWRYHVQAPYYMDGCKLAAEQSGTIIEPVKAFVFLAVEKDACVVNGVSKGVGVYVLDPESVILGRLQYRDNLNTYADSLELNKWAGYSPKIETLNLPGWMKNK